MTGDEGIHGAQEQDRRLVTLERLLAIDSLRLEAALDQASQLVAEMLGADKIDALFYASDKESLVAVGTSHTPMGYRQHAIGMDRLPLANGGREVGVFQTGVSYFTGRADEDPGQLAGVINGLGVRSAIAVPLDVAGTRRGVFMAVSSEPDFFSEPDLQFLESVSRWVGMIAHRAELLERVASEAAEQGRRAAADELITVLAHDLGNRLTPLRARIAMLERRARKDGRARDLQDIDQATHALDRFGRLISDLLDVRRLEEGLFTIDPETVDLVQVLRETAGGLSTPATDIHVEAPDEVVIYADPDRIRQALENLIGNAVKFSPAGKKVSVSVAMERRNDQPWVVLTVADQGPGLPPELLPRLFRRFERGQESSGLGLGLYLVSQIVAAHGGTLDADSTPGQGARFHLALPAAPQPDTALDDPDPAGAPMTSRADPQ
ncbi:MAG TPA: GAF domain-containing sensor histidine kinase [Thermomicrobiales bacterium]|nr:GAF domain-containing sensor histidine kinase [Thermomicrobiales bacterium]